MAALAMATDQKAPATSRGGRLAVVLEVRNPPFAETDVLTPEEVRRGLRLSRSQWFKIAPKLRVSYLLGDGSPRYIWADVLADIRKSYLP